MMEALYAFFARAAEAGQVPASFEHGFMVRALLAACLAGPLLAGLGTVVVARRLTFFTEVVGHAALTGVAIGLWLGEPPGETWAGLFGFCLATALVLEYLRRSARLPHDTLTGVVLVGSFGLGLWLLSAATTASGAGLDLHQVEGVLFGSPLGLDEGDLLLIALVGMLTVGLALRWWNPLVLGSLSPALARGSGADRAALDYGFVVVLTVVVVTSLELVGALLVLALVSVPAASAQVLTRGLSSFFWCSVAFGTTAAIGGLWLSALSPIPPGGAIALWAVSQFALARGLALALGRSAIRQTDTAW